VQLKRWAAACLGAALLALGVACGSGGATGTGSGGVDGGAGLGVGGSAATSGGGGTAGTISAGGSAGVEDAGAPPAVCEDYIACVAESTPAGLAAVLAAYGKSGSCWQQGDRSLCEQACHSGIVAAHKAFPKAKTCNVCDTSADCTSSAPACDPATLRCVECVSNSDCSDPGKPACDSAARSCVACTNDSHCASPNQPECDLATHSCVQCTNSTHCSVWTGPVCDLSSHQCRDCATDAECGSGACHAGQCKECKTDAQCPLAKPHCGSLGVCVGCVKDSECSPGVCTFGSCCGVNACAKNGVECGSTVDLGCIFQPIACGQCTANNLCVNGSCKTKPENTCVPSPCASKKCGYVPEKNAYDCVAGSSYCTANKACDPGFKCVKSSVSGSDYYTCQNYCVTSADCANAKTCQPANGPTSYGVCK
jgi:hypothetical protein